MSICVSGAARSTSAIRSQERPAAVTCCSCICWPAARPGWARSYCWWQLTAACSSDHDHAPPIWSGHRHCTFLQQAAGGMHAVLWQAGCASHMPNAALQWLYGVACCLCILLLALGVQWQHGSIQCALLRWPLACCVGPWHVLNWVLACALPHGLSELQAYQLLVICGIDIDTTSTARAAGHVDCKTHHVAMQHCLASLPHLHHVSVAAVSNAT